MNTLRAAAELALAAPSIFNSQPWSWVVYPDRLMLRADRQRQLPSVDPDGRLLAISCGAALHHAVAALTPAAADVQLGPDPADPDLLAWLRLRPDRPPDDSQLALRAAIKRRHTDRRAFARAPIGTEMIDALTAACERQGAQLYVVPRHQLSALALAAVRAGALQLSDPDYRAELADWTQRPPWSGDGVPATTAVPAAPRRVPVRDFAPFGGAGLPPGLDNDLGAIYAVVYTRDDDVKAWLTAGMSLSAVLLTATAAGLGSAPISDVTETGPTRRIMDAMLPAGHSQVALRVGHPPPGAPPSSPRRVPGEVISDATDPR
jgi:nitroreductase